MTFLKRFESLSPSVCALQSHTDFLTNKFSLRKNLEGSYNLLARHGFITTEIQRVFAQCY